MTETLDPVVAEWVREGAVVLPSRKKLPLPVSPGRIKECVARRLLDQGRDES